MNATPETPTKTWEKTRVQHLFRHKSGRFYARLFRNGKDVWTPLGTTHFSVAQAKFAAVKKEHAAQKERKIVDADAKMTFTEAATLYQERREQEGKGKRRTRKYYREVLAALLKSWPRLADSELRKISEAALKEWATSYAQEFSPSRYNGTLSLLRGVLEWQLSRG